VVGRTCHRVIHTWPPGNGIIVAAATPMGQCKGPMAKKEAWSVFEDPKNRPSTNAWRLPSSLYWAARSAGRVWS